MPRRVLIAACVAAAAVLTAGCGSEGVQLSKDDPHRAGAVLFAERCGACHTLKVAGTQGSSLDVTDKENVDGPSFDSRKEDTADVLFAIQNGGFSGAIMPENIATGPEAEAIAQFLAKYSGAEAEESGSTPPSGGG